MKKAFVEKNSPELTKKVQEWWNANPFTYLMDNQNITPDWAFFRNIDRKIIKWMPWAQKGYPLLSNVVDYKALNEKKVLDIAIGTGWSTEQLVRAGAIVTGIDLTPQAILLSKKRFEINALQVPDLRVVDAQNLPFKNEEFDYVLAFGCLMHMPNTQRAIDEIHRVLKPGGKSAAMMYYKHSLHWWYYIFFAKGILRGKLLTLSPQELSNRYTDGVYEGGNQLTKFYSKKEIRRMFGNFTECRIRIFDDTTCVDHFPHKYFPLGSFLPTKLKIWLTHIVGQTLWIDIKK